MAYARDTSVPVGRSRNEIEQLLQKHGADGFSYGWTSTHDKVEFAWQGKHIRFLLPRYVDAQVKALFPRRASWSVSAFTRAREQADRQRWRALLLVVKAKLEAVECGIAMFEQEFLAFIVLADGRTVGDCIVPRLGEGQTQRLLAELNG